MLGKVSIKSKWIVKGSLRNVRFNSSFQSFGGMKKTFVANDPNYVSPEEEVSSLFQRLSGMDTKIYDAIDIHVSGKDIPKPLEDVKALNKFLHPKLSQNLSQMKIERLTPIQRHAIPIGMTRDVMGCSQTGSGKTMAFILPILQNLLINPSVSRPTRFPKPEGMIILPTRELANQVYTEFRKFANETPISAVAVFGGTSTHAQIEKIQNSCNIIIGTPGRMLDLLQREVFDLEKIKFTVLDEADRMLHMGFSKELNAILGNTPKDRQTSMFSATFANDVQNLAKQYLKPNHVFIRVGREGSTTELIEQRFIFMSNALAGRFPKLLEILKSPQECKKTLIFSNTKDGASNIYHRLSEKGYEVGVLHGDIGQASRDNAMRRFRNSETGILVATEVAARGIDVKDIEYVINYDLPKSIDDYVHRIGRTGRTGKKGVSISFFSPENQNIAKDLVALLKEAKQVVPKELEQFASNYGGTSFGEGRRFGSSGGGGGSYSYRPSYNNRGSSFYNNNYSNRDSNSGNKRRKFDYDDHDDDDDDGDSYKFAGSSRSSSDWSGGNNKSKKNYDFSFLKE